MSKNVLSKIILKPFSNQLELVHITGLRMKISIKKCKKKKN